MHTGWLAVVFGVAVGVAACGVSNDHLGEVEFPDPPGLTDGGVIVDSSLDAGPTDGRPPDGGVGFPDGGVGFPEGGGGLPARGIGVPGGGLPPDPPGGSSDVHGVAIDLHAVAPATVVPVPQD